MGGITILLILSVTSGILVQGQIQRVPGGIQSVNGSDMNMGCSSPLVGDGRNICKNTSRLVDGCSPDIDTSTSDWASQLVTVKKRGSTSDIPFTHVLLTFAFDTAVSLTGIELDLFICPEWKIGAPYITVYGDVERNLVLNYYGGLPFEIYVPTQSSCDSLSTVIIPFRGALADSIYTTWHILVSQLQRSIDWIHVGEIRFFGSSITPVSCFTTTTFVMSTRNKSVYVMTSIQSSTITTPSTFSISSTTTTQVSTSHSPSPTPNTNPPSTTPVSTAQQTPSSFINTTTRPPEISSPTQSSTSSENIIIITAASIAGVIVLAVMILVIIICCCLSRRWHYIIEKAGGKVNVPSLTLKASSLNSDIDTKSLSDTPDPMKTGFSSPFHVQYNETEVPQNGTEYDDIISGGKQESVKENEYSYAYVTLAEAQNRVLFSTFKTTEHHKYDYVDSNNPPWALRSPDANLKPKKVEVPVVPLPVYTNVESPPPVAPKPEYPRCETHPTDALIYSEPIQPSDFAYEGVPPGKREGDDTIPKVYGSIYPIVTIPHSSLPPVEITSDKVIEMNEGAGRYGNAILAITRNMSLKDMRLCKYNTDRSLSILLALKKFKPYPSKSEQEAFDKEVKFMSILNHSNVVRFIGVCYNDPTFIMMEYMDEGDLNQFLKRYSEVVTTPSSKNQIATSTLIYMALQIASGMNCLASLGFVHRDLAIRKCFVGEHFTVKLADFGTNSLYQSHYYQIQGNILMPIRWMATECFYGKFSEKSDVWAFGVTMWELFTLARDVPYPHLSDDEVIQNALKIENRQFPMRPVACPQAVYQIVERCWYIELQQRPSFQELFKILQGLN